MFRGITSVHVDTKGRFAVPARYREQILHHANGQLVVTIDTEVKCLLLYTRIQWEPIEAKIQQLPSFDPKARRIQRLLIGHATDVDMDAMGRILLPSLLRDHANINKHMILVGQGNKFECWDEKLWEESRGKWLASSLEHANHDVLSDIAL